ncbi:ankyrin repeat domain-containing protein [Noviherbaspirillum saxi]|nr:ankyrin repeat domain-containing protein [Noviherbaspirillum saxi]
MDGVKTTPFVWAAIEGSVSVLQLLLEKIGNPDLYELQNAVTEAAENGHANVIRFIYNANLIPPYQTNAWTNTLNGWTDAFLAAVNEGHSDIVHFFIEEAGIGPGCLHNLHSPIFHFADNNKGDKQLVKYLLKNAYVGLDSPELTARVRLEHLQNILPSLYDNTWFDDYEYLAGAKTQFINQLANAKYHGLNETGRAELAARSFFKCTDVYPFAQIPEDFQLTTRESQFILLANVLTHARWQPPGFLSGLRDYFHTIELGAQERLDWLHAAIKGEEYSGHASEGPPGHADAFLLNEPERAALAAQMCEQRLGQKVIIHALDLFALHDEKNRQTAALAYVKEDPSFLMEVRKAFGITNENYLSELAEEAYCQMEAEGFWSNVHEWALTEEIVIKCAAFSIKREMERSSLSLDDSDVSSDSDVSEDSDELEYLDNPDQRLWEALECITKNLPSLIKSSDSGDDFGGVDKIVSKLHEKDSSDCEIWRRQRNILRDPELKMQLVQVQLYLSARVGPISDEKTWAKLAPLFKSLARLHPFPVSRQACEIFAHRGVKDGTITTALNSLLQHFDRSHMGLFAIFALPLCTEQEGPGEYKVPEKVQNLAKILRQVYFKDAARAKGIITALRQIASIQGIPTKLRLLNAATPLLEDPSKCSPEDQENLVSNFAMLGSLIVVANLNTEAALDWEDADEGKWNLEKLYTVDTQAKIANAFTDVFDQIFSPGIGAAKLSNLFTAYRSTARDPDALIVYGNTIHGLKDDSLKPALRKLARLLLLPDERTDFARSRYAPDASGHIMHALRRASPEVADLWRQSVFIPQKAMDALNAEGASKQVDVAPYLKQKIVDDRHVAENTFPILDAA